MFDWIKKTMSKGIWHSLAVIIVVLIAGPEVMMSMELMAMVELLGASTFVLMYISGLKLFLSKAINKFKKFESYSIFFIPSFETLKQMPLLAIHAIPERTAALCFVGTMYLGMFCVYFNVALGV
jgi:hypothetical protein